MLKYVASQSTMIVAIQAYLYVAKYATLFVAHLWPTLGGYIGHITIWESGGHLQFGELSHIILQCVG